jgi:FkbM family methyltransferase
MLAKWPRLAWYAGAPGNTVRIDGSEITLADRYLAGIARLGLYEYSERVAIRRFLQPDLPILELGTGVGVIASLANRRLQRPADHWCVDGNANALRLAAENGRRNGCAFRTLHAAVAYGVDTVTFSADENHVAGGVGQGHTLTTVAAVTLRGLLTQAGFARCTLICDIEGAERDLIDHDSDILQERVASLILETHPSLYGRSGERDVEERLTALGFTRLWKSRDVSVWRHR